MSTSVTSDSIVGNSREPNDGMSLSFSNVRDSDHSDPDHSHHHASTFHADHLYRFASESQGLVGDLMSDQIMGYPMHPYPPHPVMTSHLSGHPNEGSSQSDGLPLSPIPHSPPGVIRKILRPHSTPATLIWLEDNYEMAEGVCIPRSTLYMHYVDFCGRNSIQPVNAASFGKIIRQQFPQLTTRRLGTRGQSRYHYYGIAVRESSIYFQVQYSKKSLSGRSEPIRRDSTSPTPGSSGHPHHHPGHHHHHHHLGDNGHHHHHHHSHGHNMHGSSSGGTTSSSSSSFPSPPPLTPMGHLHYHPHGSGSSSSSVLPSTSSSSGSGSGSRPRTVLPEFPHLKSLPLPPSVDAPKMETFLMMYRTHCQRILDTVVRANFEEASVPENLAKILAKFASSFEGWIKRCLNQVPLSLQSLKVEVAKKFTHLIKRQMSISRLASAARMIVNNSDLMVQMMNDWRHIDVDQVIHESLSMSNIQETERVMGLDKKPGHITPPIDVNNDLTVRVVKGANDEFVRLLEQECSLETLLEWMDSLVHRCVVYPCIRSQNNRQFLCQMTKSFLFLWSSFGSRVIRDMTIQGASSFGSFHLLRLLFDDYILYLIEYVHMNSLIEEFLSKIPSDDILTLDPTPSFIPASIGCQGEEDHLMGIVSSSEHHQHHPHPHPISHPHHHHVHHPHHTPHPSPDNGCSGSDADVPITPTSWTMDYETNNSAPYAYSDTDYSNYYYSHGHHLKPYGAPPPLIQTSHDSTQYPVPSETPVSHSQSTFHVHF